MAKKETKTNKENNKNKKSFSKSFKAELKKVIWPTPKQLLNNTVAVITIVLITAAIVFVLDLTFETLNKQGINKVKEIIVEKDTTSEENTVANDETSEDATTEEVENNENSEVENEESNTQNNEQ